MKEYIVHYNGWGIRVEAKNEKQARHRAWMKFNEAYPILYGYFMNNIEDVGEVQP